MPGTAMRTSVRGGPDGEMADDTTVHARMMAQALCRAAGPALTRQPAWPAAVPSTRLGLRHPLTHPGRGISHLTWSKVSRGSGSGWWVCSRPGAAERPGQRRWVRLTFAGRDGMTGNRRELPRSSVAGHRSVPHRWFEGSPCGRTHPLLEVERLWRLAASQWLLGGDRPDEAGELAGAGDDDLLLWFAAAGHPLPALVEALLAAPGPLDVGRGLAALASGELVADRRPAAGVPGRFDQQPAHVRVADLRDRPLSSLLAGGVLRWDEADKRHELLGRLEAVEVADLADQRQRGQRVDPAQAPQSSDQRAPRLLLGGLTDGALELLDPSVDEIDRVQIAVEGLLLRGQLEALLGKPAAPRNSPRAGRQPPSVTQTELRKPVPVAHPIKARVLTRAHQITGRLQLRCRYVNWLQQPAREQAGQLARVPAVGLDPIARPLRHQARRHDAAVDAALNQEPIEAETGRARLVTATQRRPAAQRTLDGLLVVGKRPLLQQLVGAHRRQPDRARVNVQPNRYRRHRVVHGRRPPYVALPGHPRQPTTMRRRRPLSANNRTPQPTRLRLHPV